MKRSLSNKIWFVAYSHLFNRKMAERKTRPVNKFSFESDSRDACRTSA
jgi:hypothetical protein